MSEPQSSSAGTDTRREPRPGERGDRVLDLDRLPAHRVALALRSVARAQRGPRLEGAAQRRVEPGLALGHPRGERSARRRLLGELGLGVAQGLQRACPARERVGLCAIGAHRARRSRRGSARGPPAGAAAARRSARAPWPRAPGRRRPTPRLSCAARGRAPPRLGRPTARATVANTGSAASATPAPAGWLRRHCLRTSRSASAAPRRSDLFSTTRSASSSMSIFSSCDGAPYSGVIT